ncbi:hypothetical protein INS49_011772 [Diaporthe citri]|uniref:uncharacterized protein n=1 Tax=Diaporthe citri TaxID=83186 RepID=UPI001C7EEED0|nr:uncharacterized protein INS49_011772 [Diaporthe citri]KAG6360707.1 hypothetical protein INS49_011772 [Diaporthe citri]
MIDQGEFYKQLTRTLTPLAFRESAEKGNGSPDGDISTWYNTPGATVAAARSTATYGSDSAAQASPDIRHAGWGACSVSKAFQSLAILHFYSEGIIKSLDEPVKTNLGKAAYDIILQNSVRRGVPEDVSAQLLDRVTITQLLSHTAGTTASGFMGYSPQGDHIKTSAEVLQGGLGSANSPPVYVHGICGVQREYSGGGSTVLQAMLENIARDQGFASYALLMKEKVLDPLGMTRSFYCDAVALQQSEENYATAYQNGTYPLEDGQSFHVYPEQGAAGLWTTSLDLKGPDVAQQIFKKRPELAHEGDAYYCGFQVEFLDGEDGFPGDERLVRISHSGGNEGYRVEAGDEIVIHAMACMTNSNYGGDLCGPMICAISEMLDSPLGGGPPGGPFSSNAPFAALGPTPSAPSAGWGGVRGRVEDQGPGSDARDHNGAWAVSRSRVQPAEGGGAAGGLRSEEERRDVEAAGELAQCDAGFCKQGGRGVAEPLHGRREARVQPVTGGSACRASAFDGDWPLTPKDEVREHQG